MAKIKPVGLKDFKIEMVPIDQLKPYPGNPKAHPESQIDRIVKSIKRFGFLVPLVIDRSGEIVCGHGRYLAAQKIGIGVLPCIPAEHLSPGELRAYRIMDNRSTESVWLPEFLDAEIRALQEMDFDITLTGFSADELEFLKEESGGGSGEGKGEGKGGGFVTCPECGHRFSVLKEN